MMMMVMVMVMMMLMVIFQEAPPPKSMGRQGPADNNGTACGRRGRAVRPNPDAGTNHPGGPEGSWFPGRRRGRHSQPGDPASKAASPPTQDQHPYRPTRRGRRAPRPDADDDDLNAI